MASPADESAEQLRRAAGLIAKFRDASCEETDLPTVALAHAMMVVGLCRIMDRDPTWAIEVAAMVADAGERLRGRPPGG